MYTNRLSYLSASSGYPSSISILEHSALGLTDSPPIMMTTPSSPSSSLAPPMKSRSRQNLRQARSASSLISVDSSLAPPTPKKDKANVASSARASPQRKIPRKAPPPEVHFVPPTPGDWEAELAKRAEQLRLNAHPVVSQAKPDKLRAEQRQKDTEWERSGMWDAQQGAAREAEDRVRRDAGREIAYPPAQPRVPVRAGANGVSSVHVGVRPRLHPELSATSIERNQPDMNAPPPLFSPSLSAAPHNDLYQKAQAEYETWLSRKKEREGMMEEDAYGTRDWQPKDRVVARPSNLPPSIQHPPSSASSDDSGHASIPTPQDGDAWRDPYPYQEWYDPATYAQWEQYWAQYMQNAVGEYGTDEAAVDPYNS